MPRIKILKLGRLSCMQQHLRANNFTTENISKRFIGDVIRTVDKKMHGRSGHASYWKGDANFRSQFSLFDLLFFSMR